VICSEEIKQLKKDLSVAQKQLESRDASRPITSQQSPRRPVTAQRRPSSRHSDNEEDVGYCLEFLDLKQNLTCDRKVVELRVNQLEFDSQTQVV